MGNLKQFIEFIEALRNCYSVHFTFSHADYADVVIPSCSKCPYKNISNCNFEMMRRAASLIEDMMCEIEDLRAENKDLRWELNEAYNH